MGTTKTPPINVTAEQVVEILKLFISRGEGNKKPLRFTIPAPRKGLDTLPLDPSLKAALEAQALKAALEAQAKEKSNSATGDVTLSLMMPTDLDTDY
jgi:hypothetical protein